VLLYVVRAARSLRRSGELLTLSCGWHVHRRRAWTQGAACQSRLRGRDGRAASARRMGHGAKGMHDRQSAMPSRSSAEGRRREMTPRSRVVALVRGQIGGSAVTTVSKRASAESVSRKAYRDDAFLHEILEGVGPQAKRIAHRETCSQALLHLSRHHPERLLPHWGDLVGLLKSRNAFSKYVAIHVLENLVAIDQEGCLSETLGCSLAFWTTKV
jgi:hypothetical protein